MNKEELLNKIKRPIGHKVKFKYPDNEENKLGILKERVIIKSNNIAEKVQYYDVVDLIEFEKVNELWMRIGYYRTPNDTLVWGSQTTICEPLSVWKDIMITAAKEQPWFKELLNDVMKEL
jgi:hypothetical protein